MGAAAELFGGRALMAKRGRFEARASEGPRWPTKGNGIGRNRTAGALFGGRVLMGEQNDSWRWRAKGLARLLWAAGGAVSTRAWDAEKNSDFRRLPCNS